MAARLIAEKGPWDFAQAAKRVLSKLPQTKFVLVGDGSLLEPLRTYVKKDPLLSADRFLLPGLWRKMPSFMATLDIYTLPTFFREGMPISILEAMAMGKPVVATDNRGGREAVVNGITGLLVPNHAPEALANALLMLIEDPVMRAKLGAAGLQRVRNMHDSRKVLVEYEHVYSSILYD